MQPANNSLIKEWKSKLAFLQEELQYMLLKMRRLNSEIAIPEKHNHVQLFTEKIIYTLQEIKRKTKILDNGNISELNRINIESSLESYELIKKQFGALMNDDVLFEVA